MMRRNDSWRWRLGFLMMALLLAGGSITPPLTATAAQKEKKKKADDETTADSGGKKKKKKNKDAAATDAEESLTTDKPKKGGKKNAAAATAKAPTAKGQAMLWRGHADISQLNLFWGPGGEAGAPKAPFTFIKEDITGTNPKVKVKDARGVQWNVKFDEEVHAEVAASRLVWACGYVVEESYFIPSGKIIGVKGLGRAKNFVAADGSFTNAMFENRPDTVARRNVRWSWEANPFAGSKELSGLAILNVLLNNWDAKVDNNNVLGMYGDDGKVYDWYIQSDWGGTFGKTGTFAKSKWDVRDYTRQAFIDGVSGGKLNLHYSGKMGSALKSVPLDHAHWFASVIWQLSDEQIRDAFRAAGATDQEVTGFAARVRQKINELYAITNR